MEDAGLFKKGVKVIIIKRFINESVAQIYKANLLESNINCFISNSNTSTMIPFVDGGFTLHIDDADKVQALNIINELDQNFENPPEQDFRDADLEEIVYQKEIHEYEESLRTSSWKDLVVYGVITAIIAIVFYYLYGKL